MITTLIHGTPTRILHLEGLLEDEQMALLEAFRLDLETRPPEAWEHPWGSGGSMDPSFVGWPRVVIDIESKLVIGYQFQTRLKFDVCHGHAIEGDRLLLFVKPR